MKLINRMVKLGEICEIYGGGTPPRESKEYFGGEIPWFTPTEIGKDRIVGISISKETLTKKGLANSSAKLLPIGSVIMTSRASIGNIAIIETEATTNQGFINFVCPDSLNNKYLSYWLFTNKNRIENAANGATFKEISRGKIKEFQIPLPPLATQKQIAARLDAADALRQKDRELLARYDELVRSIFMDLFGDPVKNEKGWTIMELEKVCDLITDGTHFSPPSTKAGIPYITAKHLKAYGLDFYRDPTYISKEEHKKIYTRCNPKKGDVLYIKDGATTGIAAINNYEFEFSMLSSLALIKPNKTVLNNYYLVCFLNHPIVKEHLINNSMAGAAIKRFTLSKINRFLIPIPPIESQQHFADLVQQIEAQKAIVQKQALKSEELFQSLLQEAFG